MVMGIEVLCEEAREVFLSWVPCHIEISNEDLVCNPEEMHFHCAWLLFFDSVICNGNCGAVVTVHGCGWLRMPQFIED